MSGHTVSVRYTAVAALRRDYDGIAAEVSNTLQAHTNQSSSQSESNRCVHEFGGFLSGLVTGGDETSRTECTDRNATAQFDDENDRG